MSTDAMNHEQAVSSQAAERYVLGELSSDERDAFESHYFDCSVCFEQVELGAQFLGRAREVLDHEPEPGWLAGILGDLRRPAPVFVSAMLLCAIGIGVHQQSVISSERAPRIEARYFVPDDRKGAARIIKVNRTAALSLTIDVKPQAELSSYRVDVMNETGQVKTSLPLSLKQDEQSVNLALPANILEPGKYSVAVRGVGPNGSVTRVGGGSFELQFSE